MTAELSWTESIATVNQIAEYQVFKSTNVLPTAANFLESFSHLATIEVERDAFGEITGPDLELTDEATDFSTNFYHYYILAVPVRVGEASSPQTPPARSNILPMATPPAAVVLSGADNNGTAELSWTASSSDTTSISAYCVYVSINDGDYELVTQTSGATTSYDYDGMVRSLNNYKFKVTAKDLIGVESIDSNVVEFVQVVTAMIAVSANSGTSPRAIVSTNGTDWAPLSGLPETANDLWTTITYSESLGRWVVLGRIRDVVYSDDGVNWVVLEDVFDANHLDAWRDVLWVESFGLFVAAYAPLSGTNGQANCAAYSADGISWTLADTAFVTGSGMGFKGLVYVPSEDRVYANWANNFAYTDDGINWTNIAAGLSSSTSGGIRYGIAWGASLSTPRMVSGLQEGSSFANPKIARSSDPSNAGSWAIVNAAFGNNGDVGGICFMENVQRFVAINNNQSTISPSSSWSADGVTWTAIPDGQIPNARLHSVRYMPSFEIAVVLASFDGTTPEEIYITDDGQTFTPITNPVTDGQWYDVAEGKIPAS